MPNILPLAFVNLEKKMFINFTIYIFGKSMTPGAGPILTLEANWNNCCRGPIDDIKYKISKL
jgi:hypothetical protein